MMDNVWMSLQDFDLQYSKIESETMLSLGYEISYHVSYPERFPKRGLDVQNCVLYRPLILCYDRRAMSLEA